MQCGNNLACILQMRLQRICLNQWWQWALASHAVHQSASRLAACICKIMLRRACQAWRNNASWKANQRRLLLGVVKSLALGTLGRAFQDWAGHAQVSCQASASIDCESTQACSEGHIRPGAPIPTGRQIRRGCCWALQNGSLLVCLNEPSKSGMSTHR